MSVFQLGWRDLANGRFLCGLNLGFLCGLNLGMRRNAVQKLAPRGWETVLPQNGYGLATKKLRAPSKKFRRVRGFCPQRTLRQGRRG